MITLIELCIESKLTLFGLGWNWSAVDMWQSNKIKKSVFLWLKVSSYRQFVVVYILELAVFMKFLALYSGNNSSKIIIVHYNVLFDESVKSHIQIFAEKKQQQQKNIIWSIENITVGDQNTGKTKSVFRSQDIFMSLLLKRSPLLNLSGWVHQSV